MVSSLSLQLGFAISTLSVAEALLERTAGIEPASERWQRSALPLSYVRIL